MSVATFKMGFYPLYSKPYEKCTFFKMGFYPLYLKPYESVHFSMSDNLDWKLLL